MQSPVEGRGGQDMGSGQVGRMDECGGTKRPEAKLGSQRHPSKGQSRYSPTLGFSKGQDFEVLIF